MSQTNKKGNLSRFLSFNELGYTTLGFVSSQKKALGPKIEVQQRVLGYNPNRHQNRLPSSKGGYFYADSSAEANKKVFNLIRTPSNCNRIFERYIRE